MGIIFYIAHRNQEMINVILGHHWIQEKKFQMDWETRAFKCKVNFENLTCYSAESTPSTSTQSEKPQDIRPKAVSTPITSCTSQNPAPTSLKHKTKSSPSLALPKPQTSLAAQKPNPSKPHAQSFELQPVSCNQMSCNQHKPPPWLLPVRTSAPCYKSFAGLRTHRILQPAGKLYAQGYGKHRARQDL